MPFYGLYIPPKGQDDLNTDVNSSTRNLVFKKKSTALTELKFHKEARLREFETEEDATRYAQTGYEVVQSKYADVKTSTAAAEKPAFRAPTRQELLRFRGSIESGDYERVKAIIWDNPRYLVSSGDTPTTLKEGYRYNAMHICAIAKKPRIAELILQTVSNPEFVDLLTGKKNDKKMCKELCVNLLDYYLNIPEKGRSETPLHFASKNGCVEMIEVLTSYPECKMTQNSDGLLPKDIICSRLRVPDPELERKISALLEDRFYVPVLRSMDNAIPPQIGQPFSSNNPPNLNCDPLSPEVKIQAIAGPMNKEQAKKFCRRWKTPPRIGSSTSSPISKSPFISPMKSRNNQTPTKSSGTPGGGGKTTSWGSPMLKRRTLFSSTPQKFHNNSIVEDEADIDEADLDQTDKENGNHKHINNSKLDATYQIETNNNLQQQLPSISRPHYNRLKSGLCPSTPLMQQKRDTFFTYREQACSSPIVSDLMAQNNSVCNDSELFDSPGFQERHIKITNLEKGLEMIGRQLAKEQNVEWREYWDFLDAFIDIRSAEGLTQLENFFAQKVKDAEMKKKCTETAFSAVVVLDDVCTALEKFAFSSDANRNGLNNDSRLSDAQPAATQQSTAPYICVEKSLQVFAKRITKTVANNFDNVTSINDTLLSELKRLKSLIYSFKEDVRFINVDFTKVHSRIANLVAYYLSHSQDVNSDVKLKIQNIMENLLQVSGERREHIECVCAKILLLIEQPRVAQQLPENLKTEDMCTEVWFNELSCQCQWETNLSRKTSRRQRIEVLYKQHQQAKQEQIEIKEAKAANKKSVNFEDYRSNSTGNDSSDAEEDVFWSDFGGSDSDEDDVFLTPPEEPSSLIDETEEEAYDIFVYGNEPTKRDLDVLNAIFHLELDVEKYPNIYAWKNALMRYPNEEMDYFPSPTIVKKTHAVRVESAAAAAATKKEYPRTPFQPRQLQSRLVKTMEDIRNPPVINQQPPTPTPPPPPSPLPAQQQQQEKEQLQPPQQQQLPFPKRLFMSPLLKRLTNSFESQQPITPLNKQRGLFSMYREPVENSPMSASSVSPSAAFSNDHSGSETNKLSLLNVSSD